MGTSRTPVVGRPSPTGRGRTQDGLVARPPVRGENCRWLRAATRIETYHLERGVTDKRSPLDPEPRGAVDRLVWQQARADLEALTTIERPMPAHDHRVTLAPGRQRSSEALDLRTTVRLPERRQAIRASASDTLTGQVRGVIWRVTTRRPSALGPVR